MNAIIYETTKNFIKKGEYKRTEYDDMKDAADFIIEGFFDRVLLRPQHGNTLKPSRSIRLESNGYYSVTDKALKELDKIYNILM